MGLDSIRFAALILVAFISCSISPAAHAADASSPVEVYVWGWISDRSNRKLVIQASLLMSGLCTLWLAWQQSVSAGLFVNLVVYGAAVTSRQTLT